MGSSGQCGEFQIICTANVHKKTIWNTYMLVLQTEVNATNGILIYR